MKVFSRVHFYKTQEEGRSSPISRQGFLCPVKFIQEAIFGELFYDSRMSFPDLTKDIQLGETIEIVEMKFLSPELVLPNLKNGQNFLLWEKRIIGDGVITNIST